MRQWDTVRVAALAGARVVSAAAPAGSSAAGPGPSGVGVDTRTLAPGELFVGLRGEREDGGRHAARALTAGAWGVLVRPEHAAAALACGGRVLVHEQPLAALHALALAWRRELRERGTKLVAITGSTGKTSTKDILAALLAAHVRVAASPANLNTEIGLPLALLGAPVEAQAIVLELAMRGAGQIAELTAIAEPDVGVIVNVGPAHLGLLGSLEAIAAAKAELIAGLAPGASAILPAAEPLLEPHLRSALHTITFGEGGDVRMLERRADGSVLIAHGEQRIALWPSFAQAHNLRNLLAAVAAARALGYTPGGRLDVRFSAMRGQRERLAGGVTLIDDCYNANPMSMRAAIDELAAHAPARSVAVLGDMLELGGEGPRLHREIGPYAAAHGVDVLIAVGPLAGEIAASFAGESHPVADASAAATALEGLLREGDTVLLKGSRGVGLEHVAQRLRERPGAAHEREARRPCAAGAGSGRR